MSTYLDEKLAEPERVKNTRAQARLDQLLVRRGAPDPSEITDPPGVLEVHPIARPGVVEVWYRIGGTGGLKTLYELDHEREVLP